MTIYEHLREARQRLMISIAVFFACGTFAFIDYDQILSWLRRPYCSVQPTACTFIAIGPLDGLTIRIKIAFFAGLVFASPVVFFELWRFITPGLRKKEKRYVVPFVIASIICFVGGCVMAYFSFQHALEFLKAISGPYIQQHYTAVNYLNLIVLMMVIFGVTFELPVVLVSLEIAGIVSSRTLLKWWRGAIIAITIAAAVLTPSGDPLSMAAMGCVLVVFYFAAIGIGRLLGK
jgi:sec-independent protein translocase protein TatC